MAFEWHFIIILLGLGLLNGILAGLLGIGGGLVIVPAMIWLLPLVGAPDQHLMHMALGTSMATICFTSIASARAHFKRGSVLKPALLSLLPAIALGGLAGAFLASQLDSYWLALTFAIFAIVMGIKLLLEKAAHPIENQQALTGWQNWPVGGAMGAISALVGIGGGSLVVPYLLHRKQKMVNAIGTAAACGLPLAIMATIGYLVLGWQQADLPAYQLGFVYLPAVLLLALGSVLTAPVGVKLAHQLPTKIIKRIFAFLLILIGIKIFITTI